MYEDEYEEQDDWGSYLEKRKNAASSSQSEEMDAGADAEEERIEPEPKRVKPVPPPSNISQLYRKVQPLITKPTPPQPIAKRVETASVDKPAPKSILKQPQATGVAATAVARTTTKAKVNIAGPKQASAAHSGLVEAARAHKLAEVELLLEKGADPDEVLCGFTALHYCAFYGNEQISKVLIDNGATVDAKNLSDLTPLMWAIERGHVAVVKLLIENGAQVNLTNSKGLTPLLLAVKLNNLDIVRILTAAKANVNFGPAANDQNSALLDAAFYGHNEIVRHLLECSAEINQKNGKNRTALIRAATKDHVAVVSNLVEHSAALDLTDCNGRTALHWATSGGFVALAEVLLRAGASAELVDTNGDTAVSLATLKGNKKMLQLFSIDQRDEDEDEDEDEEAGEAGQPNATDSQHQANAEANNTNNGLLLATADEQPLLSSTSNCAPQSPSRLSKSHSHSRDDSPVRNKSNGRATADAASNTSKPKEKDVWKAILSGSMSGPRRSRRLS